MTRTKIAILGGGPSGLSTAYHLTSQPGWEKKYEITVYQMGWRLGGKGASGRNAHANQRIEEHGIHVFANMYSNTFRMMKDVLAHTPWDPNEPKSLQSMQTAFMPTNFQMITDLHDMNWTRNVAWMPNNPDVPWNPPWEPTGGDLVVEVLGIVYSILTGKESPSATTTDVTKTGLLGHWWSKVSGSVASLGLDKIANLVEGGIARQRTQGGPPTKATHGWLATLLRTLNETIGALLGELVDGNDRLRWIYRQTMYFVTLLEGVIVDDIFVVGVDPYDNQTYREWFKRHGLPDEVLNSAVVQAIPNICFHYPHGDTSKTPVMSAAAYLMFGLRQLIAKGQAVYYFASSTGDTVVMPLYRVLRERGVRFAFFHKVEELFPSDDGTTIESVQIQVQATVAAGALAYEPEVVFKDGQVVWPSRPRVELLKEKALLDPTIDLESWWTAWKGPRTLSLKRGVDFDVIVSAMPVGTLPYLAPRLLAQKESWRKMVKGLPTIATRQLQIWLKPTLEELGWSVDLPGTNRAGGPSYVQPFGDFYDFTDLVAWEAWPKDNTPGSLLYFCGPLDEPLVVPGFDDHGYPERMKEKVRWEGAQFLRDIGGLLPTASTNPTNPLTLDFDYLSCFDEKSGGTGAQRMTQQWVKANIDPNERYVTSVPGGGAARLPAWGSGYKNLVLAGDWIWTGYNLGAFEGAVMGGALASHALTGLPKLADIAGYTFLHPGDGGSPPPMLKP